jgi:hypothetical protein
MIMIPHITDCTGAPSLQVMGHRRGVCYEVQPTTAREHAKSIMQIQKCQKAAKQVILLRSSCPI